MKELAHKIEGDRSVRVIERLRDSSRLYLEDDSVQTQVDRAGRAALDHVRRMSLILQTAPSVLVLGAAGGALATLLDRRGAEVTAVDDFASSFELARRWFGLPPSVRCVHDDALQFVASARRQWTGIAIDLFRGADVPAHVKSERFVQALACAVESDGWIVWNAPGPPDSVECRSIAALIGSSGVFGTPQTLTGPSMSGVLIVASALPPAAVVQ
jgi:spermidine synthase